MGTNRKLPFGYRMDFGRIAVQPEEARWVRYIFSQYNQGMPFSAITDKMRNSSIPYDGDKQWNKNMIARILVIPSNRQQEDEKRSPHLGDKQKRSLLYGKSAPER